MRRSVYKRSGMALYQGAKTKLRYEDRRQPDWFRESEENLKLLFLERNRLYVLWLSTGKEIKEETQNCKKDSITSSEKS